MIERDNSGSQCQPRLALAWARRRAAGRFPRGSILATTGGVRNAIHPTLTLCLALALAVGCNRQERHGVDHLSGAPNLGGRTVDADGVARTQVDVRDVLQAGAAVTGTLPARGVLAGYELEAFRGGEITAELEVFDRGGPVGLAFYGPRTTTGLWDSALTESDGKTPGLVSITTEPLPTAGTYLVLVWAEDRDADARFELRLSCKGNCGAPQCPNLEPCDLVCDFGFVLDAEACRTCACQDAPQCGEGVGECGDGLICGDDGRCTRPPTPAPRVHRGRARVRHAGPDLAERLRRRGRRAGGRPRRPLRAGPRGGLRRRPPLHAAARVRGRALRAAHVHLPRRDLASVQRVRRDLSQPV